MRLADFCPTPFPTVVPVPIMQTISGRSSTRLSQNWQKKAPVSLWAYILKDKADCLKVFIHADVAFRAERIVKVYGEQEQSPEQRIRDKDKRRAAYHRFYTDMKWGHAQNYDLTLNSGSLGIDRCVNIIKELY